MKKTKSCIVCGNEYQVLSSLQKTCGDYMCASEHSRDKAKQKRIKEEKKPIKEQQGASGIKFKSWKQLNYEAQRAFNKYIHVRDTGRDCACCGCSLRWPAVGTTGAAVDASHYRSRGAASQLRFNVFNCVACCATCNRILSGNVDNLKIALIERFGEERVERLDNHNIVERMSLDYLVRVKKVFSKRANHLIKLREKLHTE